MNHLYTQVVPQINKELDKIRALIRKIIDYPGYNEDLVDQATQVNRTAHNYAISVQILTTG